MGSQATISVQRPIGLITTPAAAAVLGVSQQFLEQDRLTRRHGIPFVRVGRAIRYRQVDLDTWVERNIVGEWAAA